MTNICQVCTAHFELVPGEKELLGKLAVPAPALCGRCSEQRRFAFRNELTCYKRTCDKTGENIISIYAPDGPFKVYKREVWFSDAYDPTAYGRDFDFSRGFFEQFGELMREVPYEHMVIINSENCEYCNMIVNSKNCYLSTRIQGEDIMHCYLAIGPSRDCIDCHTVEKCELCYECIDCSSCFDCGWCQRCKQCSDCSFCIDCSGCNNCFGCAGLNHKQYHIFNQPYTKEDYQQKMSELNTSSHTTVERVLERLADAEAQRPQRASYIEQSENCTGDYIMRSHNVHDSFDVQDSEDAYESYGCEFGKDVARSSHVFYPELLYEHLSCTYAQNVRFSYGAYNAHDIEYCMMVHGGTHDCFGCVGLKQNSYCILNKQYTKEQYEELVPKIIAHMSERGEYGQFFSPSLSHFAYNETYAQQVYPLTREEALAKGFRWRDAMEEPPQSQRIIAAADLPDSVENVDDEMLQCSIVCEQTGKLFRIIRKELDFYRAHHIPLPRLHPFERHLARARKRRPQQLWNRACAKCSKDIQTTCASANPAIVYCEECYLSTVY